MIEGITLGDVIILGAQIATVAYLVATHGADIRHLQAEQERHRDAIDEIREAVARCDSIRR